MPPKDPRCALVTIARDGILNIFASRKVLARHSHLLLYFMLYGVVTLICYCILCYMELSLSSVIVVYVIWSCHSHLLLYFMLYGVVTLRSWKLMKLNISNKARCIEIQM